MSNLNKQAVYDLFFRIGKTAGITKIATPPKQLKSRTKKGQPTIQELASLQKLRDAGNTLEANNLEDILKSTYPEYNNSTSTSKNPTSGNIPDDETIRRQETKAFNLHKANAIADILVNHADSFSDGEERSYVRSGHIPDERIRNLAQLDSTIASDTSKNQAKYTENKDLALQKLDDTIKMLGQYPELQQIVDSNKPDDAKKQEIKKLMASSYYNDEGQLLPPQQPSPIAAPVTPTAPEPSYSQDYETAEPIESTEQSKPGFLASLQSQAGDLGNYVKNQAGELSSAAKNQYNKYQEGRAQEKARQEAIAKVRQEALRKAQQKRTNITPQPSNATQAPVVAQPSETNDPEISEEATQSINPEVSVTEPQTSSPTTAPIAAKPSKPVIRMLPLEDVQQEVTTPAPVAQPTTPATPQTPKLTGNALQRRLADLEAETKREEARQRAQAIVDSEAKKLNPIKADAKINKELAKLNRKPQVDTFDRTKALNNLKGGLGEQSPSYVDTSKIESDPISADRTYSSYLPAIDPSARLNFGMGETPPDLVFTEEDLAALNSQYPEASPIDTPPVVPQTPRANNNAPVAAKPSTQANDLLFNEPKETPRSKQNLAQEYYGMSSPTNPNAKTKQFYTIKNAPSQGYDPIQGITSRISTGNFGPAPSAPAARSQNRAVSAPRVARKPRPVAKPTFDRKGYGDMMSDFGYGNTSPKPIPQNLTNLMPKRTTPINSVVGPAKPLDKILSNKPTATTSPAPKPVMDTTATTKAPPQIKQSFLSQFGIY